MMSTYGTIYVTVELGMSSLEVAVDYCATPGTPMIKYLSDGSGDPGSAPEAELIDVTVSRWDVGSEERERDDSWVWERLDEIARSAIEREWNSRYEYQCLEDASCEADD